MKYNNKKISDGEETCGEFMEKQYTIYIPYPKEQILEKIEQTTKPLEFSNQAYKKTILSSYSEKTESICVSYAAGSMNGGGFEMMKMQIKYLGDNTILEGEFVPITYIKKGVQLFFIVLSLMAVIFSGGEILILVELIAIFFFPLLLLYKNLSQIVKNDEGRQQILQYLEEELAAKIEELSENV